MAKYSYPFDPDASENTAAAIYRLARNGGREVLDVGSGPGIVAAALTGADDKVVTCLDFDSEALEEAKRSGVSETHVIDLETPDWSAPVEGRAFDTVILADVLEHLRRPELVLQDLRDGLVRPDGQLVVSIPNAAHQALVAELLSGNFDYTTTGLIDATHLRWFTRRSITELLESCGFLVTEVHRTHRTLEQTAQAQRLLDLPPNARELLASLGDDASTLQYILRAVPSTHTGQMIALREELATLRGDLKTQQNSVVQLERDLTVAKSLVEQERQFALQELTAGREVVEATRRENERLRKRAAQMKRWNNDIRRSASFRVARVLAAATHPGRSLRRLARRAGR